MRVRVAALAALTLLLLLLSPALAAAQAIDLEWNRWDTQIVVRSGTDQMQVIEAQEIRINSGTVRFGTRTWTAPVQIQGVFVVLSGESTPTTLRQNTSGASGTYQITQQGGRTVLRYVLPQPQGPGDTFLVQIGYIATSPTTNMVDWNIVPRDHSFPVRSSTARIRFPNAAVVPDISLVRTSQQGATAEVRGTEIIVQASNIAPQQAFALQIPYGEGVGAAGNAGGRGVLPQPQEPSGAASEPVPADPGGGFGVDLGSLLLMGIALLALLLFGGNSLVRTLLGSLISGGMSRGGMGFPPTYSGRPTRYSRDPNPFDDGPQYTGSGTPPGGSRGFRRSADQNRQLGNIGGDKDGGGGASFG